MLNWRDSSEVRSTDVAPGKLEGHIDCREGELNGISWVTWDEGACGRREGMGGENMTELDGQGGRQAA